MKRYYCLLIVSIASLFTNTNCCQVFSCDWISSFDNDYPIYENPTPFLTAAAKLNVCDLEPSQPKISLEKWAAKHAEKVDNICWEACGCGETDPDSEFISFSHICADLMVGTSNMDYFVISVKLATESRTFLEKPELYALYVKYHEDGESTDTFSEFEKAIKNSISKEPLKKGIGKR